MLDKIQKQERKSKKVNSLSRVRLFATPWTVAYQASLSMESSRQEQWSGLPFPSPGDLSNPGIEPMSPELQADALTSEPPGKSFLNPSNLIFPGKQALYTGVHDCSSDQVYSE